MLIKVKFKKLKNMIFYFFWIGLGYLQKFDFPIEYVEKFIENERNQKIFVATYEQVRKKKLIFHSISFFCVSFVEIKIKRNSLFSTWIW